MGSKLPPEHMALYRRIDEILWTEWDPIGVSDSPEARDEYYAYVPLVFRLAQEGADASRISAFLNSCETESMGLPGDTLRCDRSAELICSERDKLLT